MNLTRQSYVMALLQDMVVHPKLVDVAIIFWHSEIPIEEAKIYIKRIADKLERW